MPTGTLIHRARSVRDLWCYFMELDEALSADFNPFPWHEPPYDPLLIAPKKYLCLVPAPGLPTAKTPADVLGEYLRVERPIGVLVHVSGKPDSAMTRLPRTPGDVWRMPYPALGGGQLTVVV